jgi:uncharacterized protein (DUF302 family)
VRYAERGWRVVSRQRKVIVNQRAVDVRRRHCAFCLALTLSQELHAVNQSETHHGELVERLSKVPFAATLDRITASIEAAGMQVFARIDHAAAASAVGLAMPPTTVLIYGNARGGTPVMLDTPVAALDLPLRVLVREDVHGRVCIALHPVVALLKRAGVSEQLASRLMSAQSLLIDAIRP